MRVDLATGALLALSPDSIPGGLDCQPVRAPDGVLFACAWDRGQGYGGYVLRSVNGAPPVVEKAFSDEGSFVADEDGALRLRRLVPGRARATSTPTTRGASTAPGPTPR